MLDKLTIDDFQDRIGETFQASPSEGSESFELELRRADLSQHADQGGYEDASRKPFSVEFHSRLPEHVPQQIFALENEKLGKLEVFLVPLGPDADGHRYEAVFA